MKKTDKYLLYAAGGLVAFNLVKGLFGKGMFDFLSPGKGVLSFKFTAPLDGSTHPNRTDQQLKQIAEQQYKAMDRIGTDTGTLFSSLDGLNGKALQQVAIEFGRRRYNWFEGTAFLGELKNLFQWYIEELTPAETRTMLNIWQKAAVAW